jgi:hypothetical protein
MSKDRMDIWLDGERELFMNMQKKIGGLGKAGRQALQKGGMIIVNDAKVNLRNNGSVVTGMLRASGKVQKVQGDEDAVDAGFFSQQTTGGYAFFVEYGRRAGKMPPVNFIEAWLKKKSTRSSGIKSAFKSASVYAKMKPEAYLKHLAWAIARAIARKGTRPHPFFGPAVEKNKKAVVDAIAEAINKETK